MYLHSIRERQAAEESKMAAEAGFVGKQRADGFFRKNGAATDRISADRISADRISADRIATDGAAADRFIVTENLNGLRLDQALVKAGFAENRSQALKQIQAGGARLKIENQGKSSDKLNENKLSALAGGRAALPSYKIPPLSAPARRRSTAGPESAFDRPLRASYRLKTGEVLNLRIPSPLPQKISWDHHRPLERLYEDEEILVVNKPAGIVTHPAPGHEGDTLLDRLIFEGRLPAPDPPAPVATAPVATAPVATAPETPARTAVPEISAGTAAPERPFPIKKAFATAAPETPARTAVSFKTAPVWPAATPAAAERKRTGVVHRLDQDVSGAMVFAKTPRAEADLIRQFKARTVKRIYWALTVRTPKNQEGFIETYIGRHPVNRKRFISSEKPIKGGKKALTFYKILSSAPVKAAPARAGAQTNGGESHHRGPHRGDAPRCGPHHSGSPLEGAPLCAVSRTVARPEGDKPRPFRQDGFRQDNMAWLECRLQTGRTHQIRLHLASLGCPVTGDRIYGGRRLARPLSAENPANRREKQTENREKPKNLSQIIRSLNRTALHARFLAFKHPVTKQELSFSLPWPEDLQELVAALTFPR